MLFDFFSIFSFGLKFEHQVSKWKCEAKEAWVAKTFIWQKFEKVLADFVFWWFFLQKKLLKTLFLGNAWFKKSFVDILFVSKKLSKELLFPLSRNPLSFGECFAWICWKNFCFWKSKKFFLLQLSMFVEQFQFVFLWQKTMIFFTSPTSFVSFFCAFYSEAGKSIFLILCFLFWPNCFVFLFSKWYLCLLLINDMNLFFYFHNSKSKAKMICFYFSLIFQKKMFLHEVGQPCDCVLVIDKFRMDELESNGELREPFQTVVQDVNVSSNFLLYQRLFCVQNLFFFSMPPIEKLEIQRSCWRIFIHFFVKNSVRCLRKLHLSFFIWMLLTWMFETGKQILSILSKCFDSNVKNETISLIVIFWLLEK